MKFSKRFSHTCRKSQYNLFNKFINSMGLPRSLRKEYRAGFGKKGGWYSVDQYLNK